VLCHQLPTLTDDDVKTDVKPASPHTFQKSSSCMRCHSSIDGMAYGYRNLFIYTSSGNPDVERQAVGLNFSGFAALVPSASASTFAVLPPEGRLHFRELVSGAHRDVKFTSLAQLGTLLAGYEDIYTCAAKRYYKFFTGVDVDLTAKATDKVDKMHQDQVLALGKTLKSGQSVRTMLRALFASRTYKSSNYLTEKTP
jgi:hypothetical protein